MNFIDPYGKAPPAIILVPGIIAGALLVHDFYKFYNNEPSYTGDVKDWFKKKFDEHDFWEPPADDSRKDPDGGPLYCQN